MRFEEADRLLDPAPMALETGYERLENGVLHVACRTDLHRCNGAMLEWWFGARPDTRQYRWWHPHDHISSEWIEGRAGTPVGSIHLVEEYFVGPPSVKLSIQFRDPDEFFTPSALAAAKTDRRVSGLVVARGSESHEPRRTPEGAITGARLIHLCRDTAWGAVLRSHFFLGQDLPAAGAPPAAIVELIPDASAPRLLQHCYEEFTFLSRILPPLYGAENADPITVPRPW
jgi:DAPG hydrolase PhiG domain